MNEEQVWALAMRVERCALGWAQDALLYKGRRRIWREERAERLMDRVNKLIMVDLNAFAMRVVEQTLQEAQPRELQPGVFSE